MQYLHATRKNLTLDDYKRRAASEEDCSQFVTEDTTVLVSGKPVVVYFAKISDKRLEEVSRVLPKVKYDTSTRTSGMVTTSKIFGYAPRNELRNHPCRATSFAATQPMEHATIANAADVVAKYYLQTFPELAQYHAELAKSKVRKEYRIAETMFTSGIVNHNNPLRYHFDSGNFKNVCSAMLAFKHKVAGGHLCVPELDIKFEIADRSLLLFDGQGLLHGVTPIKKLAPDAHRYTIVYYSLQQMWNCEFIGDEIARLRAKRTKLEAKKAKK